MSPPSCRCHPRKASNLCPVSDNCVPLGASVLSTLTRSPILMSLSWLPPHRPATSSLILVQGRRHAD
eukprot:3871272-Heterocapsa_arctica.AAC.1